VAKEQRSSRTRRARVRCCFPRFCSLVACSRARSACFVCLLRVLHLHGFPQTALVARWWWWGWRRPWSQAIQELWVLGSRTRRWRTVPLAALYTADLRVRQARSPRYQTAQAISHRLPAATRSQHINNHRREGWGVARSHCGPLRSFCRS